MLIFAAAKIVNADAAEIGAEAAQPVSGKVNGQIIRAIVHRS